MTYFAGLTDLKIVVRKNCFREVAVPVGVEPPRSWKLSEGVVDDLSTGPHRFCGRGVKCEIHDDGWWWAASKSGKVQMDHVTRVLKTHSKHSRLVPLGDTSSFHIANYLHFGCSKAQCTPMCFMDLTGRKSSMPKLSNTEYSQCEPRKGPWLHLLSATTFTHVAAPTMSFERRLLERQSFNNIVREMCLGSCEHGSADEASHLKDETGMFGQGSLLG
jgi:hypothetical protein